MKSRNEKRFTLIELLVVIGIIGLMVTVGVVSGVGKTYSGFTSSSQLKQRPMQATKSVKR